MTSEYNKEGVVERSKEELGHFMGGARGIGRES